jgi:LPS export ABC transporter protein LptC/lipopolysaccharide transport protein LptA
MKWQKVLRLAIAAGAAAFAIVMVVTFRPRAPQTAPPSIGITDPKAVVESSGASTTRFNRDKEDVRIDYQRALTYGDGSTKFDTVTVTTTRSGGKTFVIRGDQGEVGKDEASMVLAGNVLLTATDGLELNSERATYNENDGLVRAEGPVTFRRGRLNGSGVGLIYDKNRDAVTIQNQVSVQIGAGGEGEGATSVLSQSAYFARQEHLIRFEGGMKADRSGQIIESDLGVAQLTVDEQRLETLELRGHSRITGAPGAAGGLQAMSGRDIDLKYGPDGQTISQATITGDALVRLAGNAGDAGRQIGAAAVDMALADDGSTPTALAARENVEFVLPGEKGTTRTIRAQTFDGKGEASRGLTGGRFTGDVLYLEQAGTVTRTARSAVLDVALGPGLATIDEARFARSVQFTEGAMQAAAASARYVLNPGSLELTGSEPGRLRPHLVNERLTVDATRIDVVLEGPRVKADGNVASELKPTKPAPGDTNSSGARTPAMFQDDQPVAVTAEHLAYDGVSGQVTYTGNALLWQGDTSIKGASIVLDEKSGDIVAGSAEGGVVATTTMLDDKDADGKVTRSRSISTARDFRYEEASHKATYIGDAHISGPQGDMTAPRIELYLKPSGDELERAEGYDGITLREKNRKTKGSRMTYYSADERYVVTGTPVVVIDECGRETVGRTLTFFQATDRILVDGNEQMRTQTRSGSGSKCP